MENIMRIMGIDPGTNYMGYGILEIVGGKPHPLILGDIDLHKIGDAHQKLRYIFERVQALVREYHPTEVDFESPFFGTHVQSMLKLGRAQGVAIAAVLNTEEDIAIAEYAPTRIKQAITGRGQASKQQIAAMINSMLKTDYQPRRLDATDGMAVALCHYYMVSSPIHQALADERAKGLGGGKKGEKKKMGHRQPYTKVEITKIAL